MFRRQRTGSVICSSCGVLVGVNDDRCYNCGRSNPGLWGFGPLLRALGRDMGFTPFVIGSCAVLYVLTLVASGGGINMRGLFGLLGPSQLALILFGATGPAIVFGAGHWYTLLSASWLHGGALHIILNMMAVRQLGPAVADLYGPARMVIIYVVSGKARMRWGERLEYTAEAGPGDFIYVPPFVPHQEINANPDEPLACVLVRSGQDPVVVNLDIEPIEKPENVAWVDSIHPDPNAAGS